MPNHTSERFPRSLRFRPKEPVGPAAVAPAASSLDEGPTVAPHERLLVGAARQSGVGDPDSCRTIVAILAVSRAVRRRLAREFGTKDLTESRFATLITLHAMAPLAATPADLAYHTEVSRAAMTGVVEALDQRGWIVRTSRGGRRPTPVRISAKGRNVAVQAVQRFLEVASVIAGDLCVTERRTMVESCARIERSANRPASAQGA